jgi:hypothetical protein
MLAISALPSLQGVHVLVVYRADSSLVCNQARCSMVSLLQHLSLKPHSAAAACAGCGRPGRPTRRCCSSPPPPCTTSTFWCAPSQNALPLRSLVCLLLYVGILLAQVRAGEGESEAEDYVLTNPVAKTSMSSGLSKRGTLQVHAAIRSSVLPGACIMHACMRSTAGLLLSNVFAHMHAYMQRCTASHEGKCACAGKNTRCAGFGMGHGTSTGRGCLIWRGGLIWRAGGAADGARAEADGRVQRRQLLALALHHAVRILFSLCMQSACLSPLFLRVLALHAVLERPGRILMAWQHPHLLHACQGLRPCRRAYQSAEILAALLGVGQSRIVPEYSFLDPRCAL